jgi:tight adherence protein B
MPDYNSYEMTPKETRRYYLIAVSILLFLGQIFYQSLILGALLAPLSVPCKRLYARRLARNRRVALGLSFRDLLYSLSASFSTGRLLPEALNEGLSALRLIYKDDAPIVLELEHMTARLLRSRDDERAVLDDFANRSRCEDIRNFVDAYFICRTTGGDMESLVAKASALIIDKIEIKKELRTLTAQKRLEANILLLLPALILVLLQLFSPDYIAVLYEDLRGRLVMTAALGLTALSYFWSLRLTDFEARQ